MTTYSLNGLKRVWENTWQKNVDRFNNDVNQNKTLNLNREKMKRTFVKQKEELTEAKHQLLNKHHRKWQRTNNTPPSMITPLNIFIGHSTWQYNIKIKLKRGGELYTSKIFFFFKYLD